MDTQISLPWLVTAMLEEGNDLVLCNRQLRRYVCTLTCWVCLHVSWIDAACIWSPFIDFGSLFFIVTSLISQAPHPLVDCCLLYQGVQWPCCLERSHYALFIQLVSISVIVKDDNIAYGHLW